MNLFYTPPQEIHDRYIFIKGQEAVHITKVLRMKTGDSLEVTDGEGMLYRCKIVDSAKKKLTLEINSSEIRKPASQHATLCLGFIRKRDRLEFAVEKCVELGVRQIIIFRGEHSQKGGIRIDRLESTALSAMKQSLRFYLPDIAVEKSLKEAIEKHAGESAVILADEQAKHTPPKNLPNNKHRFLIVGPEGGFSEAERELLETYSHEKVSLGSYRLRAETAAVVMAARFAGP